MPRRPSAPQPSKSEVSPATSVSPLLKAAENGSRIDLVFTDVVVRGLSGPELGSRLASPNPATRILYMSGYSSELFEENGGSLPASSLLEKPFSRPALLFAVHAAMS